MAILVTRERHFPEADTWVEAMRRRVPEIVSLVQNVNPRQGNVILGDESIVLWGAHHLIESIGHREFLISPTSFFQVNPVQAKELYDVVRQDAAVGPGDVVWDVYCGAGTIGIYVATEGVRLRGVEKVAAAVEDAWRNARLNGIDDAHFEQGDAETALPKWVAREREPTWRFSILPGADRTLRRSLPSSRRRRARSFTSPVIPRPWPTTWPIWQQKGTGPSKCNRSICFRGRPMWKPSPSCCPSAAEAGLLM